MAPRLDRREVGRPSGRSQGFDLADQPRPVSPDLGRRPPTGGRSPYASIPEQVAGRVIRTFSADIKAERVQAHDTEAGRNTVCPSVKRPP